jgi:uncharacterized membrane protein
MSLYQQLANSKPKLLVAVIIAVVGGVSVPFLLPHVFHGNHIYHLLLHTAGIVLATFLTVLGVNAYYQLRSKKMAITSVAFSLFAASELVQLINATETHVYDFFESPSEIAHLMLLGVVGLFALAIFRRD